MPRTMVYLVPHVLTSTFQYRVAQDGLKHSSPFLLMSFSAISPVSGQTRNLRCRKFQFDGVAVEMSVPEAGDVFCLVGSVISGHGEIFIRFL